MNLLKLSAKKVIALYKKHNLKPTNGFTKPIVGGYCCAIGIVFVVDLKTADATLDGIARNFKIKSQNVWAFASGFDRAINGNDFPLFDTPPHYDHGFMIGKKCHKEFLAKKNETP